MSKAWSLGFKICRLGLCVKVQGNGFKKAGGGVYKSVKR